MYLHIGNGKSIKKDKIIGIFDLDTATVSKITKEFLNKNSKRGNLEYTDNDLPRTFVLHKEENNYKIKLSRISTQGLKLRATSCVTEE